MKGHTMKYVLTYGIACIEEQHGKKELISELGGITTHLDEAQYLVNLFNEKMLPPDKLRDAILEYLSNQ